MELWIPSQNIEIGKIHLCGFKTEDKYAIAPLQYIDGDLIIDDLTIITPPLIVHSYDPITGRLQFDISDYTSFTAKMNAIQAYLIGTLFIHQKTLFGITAAYTHEQIQNMIQYIVYKNKMTLYTGSNSAIRLFEYDKEKDIVINSNIKTTTSLTAGSKIRCAINIKGISCVWNFNTSMPRLRFQHMLKAAYCIH